MKAFHKVWTLTLFGMCACGEVHNGDAGADASSDATLDASVVDAFPIDAETDSAIDVGSDAGNAADASGFGLIAGPCGMVAGELETPTPSLFVNRLDFADDRFDDPGDIDLLTAGAQRILDEGTLGGSSGLSEAFAYEVLERCEGASLLKSESLISYMEGTTGAFTDILVELEGLKIGVSVTRAVGFPRDDPYTIEDGASIIERKLSDVLESTARVADGDRWVKQILLVMAYADMHAESLQTAWDAIDASVRADTIVYVVITDGMDGPIYGD